jgi:hypothetical protein
MNRIDIDARRFQANPGLITDFWCVHGTFTGLRPIAYRVPREHPCSVFRYFYVVSPTVLLVIISPDSV